MADYVSVSVAIKANDEALGKMRDVLEKMVSLKHAIESSHNVPDIEGKGLDNRSHIDGCLTFNERLVVLLEQPWNVNLGRFVNWVKTYDEDAEVTFIATYPDGDKTTNDRALYDKTKRIYWEDIDE